MSSTDTQERIGCPSEFANSRPPSHKSRTHFSASEERENEGKKEKQERKREREITNALGISAWPVSQL